MRFRSIHGPGVFNGGTARGIIMNGVTGHMGTDQHLFLSILAPTAPLSRHIFKALIRFYKMGVVFMAELNGHQDHFSMVGGERSARSALHLANIFWLIDKAGLPADPDLVDRRNANFIAQHDIA
jgi:hypothetical protein